MSGTLTRPHEEPPFGDPSRPDALFRSASLTEALARLRFAATSGYPLAVLQGREGVGKSHALRRMAFELEPAQWLAIRLGLRDSNPDRAIRSLAAALGSSARGAAEAAVRRLATDRLRAQMVLGRSAVILLDDVPRAAPGPLIQLVRLLLSAGSSRLTMVLATSSPTHALDGELLALSPLLVPLDPWEPGEVADYITGCLVSRGVDAGAFAPCAMQRLHELTAGVPRWVNRLAGLAWAEGSARGSHPLDSADVEHAFIAVQRLGKSCPRCAA